MLQRVFLSSSTLLSFNSEFRSSLHRGHAPYHLSPLHLPLERDVIGDFIDVKYKGNLIRLRLMPIDVQYERYGKQLTESTEYAFVARKIPTNRNLDD
ncbi:MAG: hypothetical protein EOP04_25350, partial [Proteobacteria bacterium]